MKRPMTKAELLEALEHAPDDVVFVRRDDGSRYVVADEGSAYLHAPIGADDLEFKGDRALFPEGIAKAFLL